MKRRKNIRGAFKARNQQSNLPSSTVTNLTTYTNHTDNMWVFYTLASVDKKLSFTDDPINV
jgi:hypothetical protein